MAAHPEANAYDVADAIGLVLSEMLPVLRHPASFIISALEEADWVSSQRTRDIIAGRFVREMSHQAIKAGAKGLKGTRWPETEVLQSLFGDTPPERDAFTREACIALLDEALDENAEIFRRLRDALLGANLTIKRSLANAWMRHSIAAGVHEDAAGEMLRHAVGRALVQSD